MGLFPKCIPAGVFYANKCSSVFGGVGRKLRLLTELLRNSRIFFANTNHYWGVVRSLRSLPSFLRKLAVAYANKCSLVFGGVGRKLRLLTELLRNSRIFFANTNHYWGVVRSLRSLPSFLRKLAVAYANRCFLIFGGVAGVSPAEGVAEDTTKRNK